MVWRPTRLRYRTCGYRGRRAATPTLAQISANAGCPEGRIANHGINFSVFHIDNHRSVVTILYHSNRLLSTRKQNTELASACGSIRRHRAVALGALLAGNASGMADLLSPLAGLWQILTLIAGPVLSYGYLALFVTLTRTDAWRHRPQPLAAMALSNDITLSIICTLIFYSYGLGLFGQVGAFVGLVISVTIWLVQLGVSVVWLKRFRYGPLEWAWRSLTYGKRQTMSLSASRPSAA
jgi:uncharacterized membrane protein YeiB